MRVAVLFAAIAALWMQPAKAVTILLTSPDPAAGVHQKVTLTGLTAGDVITAEGSHGSLNTYYWMKLPGDQWMVEGNTAPSLAFCTAKVGAGCQRSEDYVSAYPGGFAKASVQLAIIGNEVFVDWSRAAGDVCASIPESQRSASFAPCGFRYIGQDGLSLDITVKGPSAKTFGYSVAAYNPVPEPATWALMLLGVGLIGASMRRHVRVTVFCPATQSPHPSAS